MARKTEAKAAATRPAADRKARRRRV